MTETISETPIIMSAESEARRLRQLIAGRWLPGAGPEIVDTNPARPDEVVARGNVAVAQQLDAAVGGAVSSYPGWAATPFPARAEILSQTAALLSARAEEWGTELAREEGKTRAEGTGEVRRAAEIFRFYASEAFRPMGELYASPRAGEQIQLVHRPVGVIAVITPFNFPIAIPA